MSHCPSFFLHVHAIFCEFYSFNQWCKSAADDDGIAHEVMLMYCSKSGWGLWNEIVVFGKRQDVCVDHSWWSTACLIVPLSLVFVWICVVSFFGPNTWCNVLVLMGLCYASEVFDMGGIVVRDRMWVLITAIGARHVSLSLLFPYFHVNCCELLHLNPWCNVLILMDCTMWTRSLKVDGLFWETRCGCWSQLLEHYISYCPSFSLSFMWMCI